MAPAVRVTAILFAAYLCTGHSATAAIYPGNYEPWASFTSTGRPAQNKEHDGDSITKTDRKVLDVTFQVVVKRWFSAYDLEAFLKSVGNSLHVDYSDIMIAIQHQATLVDGQALVYVHIVNKTLEDAEMLPKSLDAKIQDSNLQLHLYILSVPATNISIACIEIIPFQAPKSGWEYCEVGSWEGRCFGFCGRRANVINRLWSRCVGAHINGILIGGPVVLAFLDISCVLYVLYSLGAHRTFAKHLLLMM